MVKKASFFCSMYLDFNNAIDTDKINKILNLSCKKHIKKHDYNWGIDNGGYKEYLSLEEALGEFFKLIKGKVNDIIKIRQLYKSERPLLIVEIIVYDNCFPELCIDGENMDIIHALNADVHFNISNEVSVEDSN